MVFAGCGQKESGPANSVQAVTPPIDQSTAGTIQGNIRFSGPVPKARKLKISGNPECAGMVHGDLYSEELVVSDGNLANAVVYIKQGLEKYQFPVPKEPALLDQKDCTFVPHVLAVQKYQPIELVNNDPTMHNVHALPKNSRGFNIGFPTKGMKQVVQLSENEVSVPVKCDLHPWMKNYIGVFDHPYFKVTDEDGSFSFSPLPSGEYTIEVWHEKLGTQSQTVTVRPNKAEETNFTFSLK